MTSRSDSSLSTLRLTRSGRGAGFVGRCLVFVFSFWGTSVPSVRLFSPMPSQATVESLCHAIDFVSSWMNPSFGVVGAFQQMKLRGELSFAFAKSPMMGSARTLADGRVELALEKDRWCDLDGPSSSASFAIAAATAFVEAGHCVRRPDRCTNLAPSLNPTPPPQHPAIPGLWKLWRAREEATSDIDFLRELLWPCVSFGQAYPQDASRSRWACTTGSSPRRPVDWTTRR